MSWLHTWDGFAGWSPIWDALSVMAVAVLWGLCWLLVRTWRSR